MTTQRGRFQNVDAAALDAAMRAGNIDAATLHRWLIARPRGASCSPQYIRQMRTGQRVRVRTDLAQAIEFALLSWSPAGQIFTDAEQVSA